MKLTAQVTIEYNTPQELEAIQAKLPPGIVPIIEAVLKRISFTVVQEITDL